MRSIRVFVYNPVSGSLPSDDYAPKAKTVHTMNSEIAPIVLRAVHGGKLSHLICFGS
jgi:hypothetical protein